MSRAKNSLYLIAATVFTQVLQILAVRYYLQWLGEESWGLFSIVLVTMQYVTLLTMGAYVGATRLIVQAFAAGNRERAWRTQQCFFWFYMVVAAIGATVAVGLAFIYKSPQPEYALTLRWMFFGAALNFIFRLMDTSLGVMLGAQERFANLAVRRSVEKIVVVGVSLVGAYYFRTPMVLVVGSIIGAFVSLIINAVTIRLSDPDFRFRPRFDRDIIRDLAQFTLRSFPHHFGSTIASSADRLLMPFALQNTRALALVANYNIAYRVPETIAGSIGPINDTLVPHLIRKSDEDPHAFSGLVDRYARIAFGIGLTFVMITAGFGYPLLKLWLGGEKPMGVEWITLLIGVYFAIDPYYITMIKVFYAVGKPQKAFPFTVFNAVMMLAFSYPIIGTFGLLGVAIQKVCIQLVMIFPYLWTLRKHAAPYLDLKKHFLLWLGAAGYGGTLTAIAFGISHLPVIQEQPLYALPLIPIFMTACALGLMRMGLTPVPEFFKRRARFLAKWDSAPATIARPQ